MIGVGVGFWCLWDEEIIDLTTDEVPDEFTMVVDIPSDDENIDDINKQVGNIGGGDSENEDEDEDSAVLDDKDESMQLDYISE